MVLHWNTKCSLRPSHPHQAYANPHKFLGNHTQLIPAEHHIPRQCQYTQDGSWITFWIRRRHPLITHINHTLWDTACNAAFIWLHILISSAIRWKFNWKFCQISEVADVRFAIMFELLSTKILIWLCFFSLTAIRQLRNGLFSPMVPQVKTAIRRPHGPLTRYVKLRVAHAPGMPGTFSPSPTSKENAT